MADVTTIKISKKTKALLDAKRNDPNESYDDIINELIDRLLSLGYVK